MLRQELATYASLHPGFHIDVLISSPLSRAIQTTLIGLADYHQQYFPPDPSPDRDYVQPDPIILHPDCAEHLYCLSDVGRPLSTLLPTFSHFSFNTTAFHGREDGWWYAAHTHNKAVWGVMQEHYPDQMQRELEMEIERSTPEKADDVRRMAEEEMAHHGHALNHAQSTGNSPRHNKASHHAMTTPVHRGGGGQGGGTDGGEGGGGEEEEEEVHMKDLQGQELTIRLHPSIVVSEGDERLRQRLGRFLQFVCGFPGSAVVCVVCHSQVINTLGQGWLENGEMVQMDWSKIPKEIVRKAREHPVGGKAEPHHRLHINSTHHL